MKRKITIIASILLPVISAVAGQKGNLPEVSSAALAQAKATGKMVLVGKAAFGDRHIKGFLDRNFILQDNNSDSQTAYLLYNENGQLVHRVVGEEKYPYELAVKIKRGLDENTQYYTLMKRFDAGERSIELLENALIAAQDAHDAHLNPIMVAYIQTLGNQPSEQQLNTVAKYTQSTQDAGFAYLMAHDSHTEKLADIIFEDTFAAKAATKNIDVAALVNRTKAQYPSAALTAHIDRMGIELLEIRGDRAGLKAAVPAYLASNKDTLTEAQVAYYAGLINK